MRSKVMAMTKNEIHRELSHASLRIIVNEQVRVLMTRGYVDDTMLASSGSGVSLAVWNRGSRCWCLLT